MTLDPPPRRSRRPRPAVLVRRWATVLIGLATVILLGDMTWNGLVGSTSGAAPRASAPTFAAPRPAAPARSDGPSAVSSTSTSTSADLPGMPPVLDPSNVYSADAPADMNPAVAGDIPLVYVPNSLSNTVTEIDPTTMRVVRTFAVGALPQHVVPSWDLKTLWVTNDDGNSLTPINPRTGLPGPAVPVEDPYNMYFTPNGRYAIVVAEHLERLDFRNPHTMALVHSLSVPCYGVDHIDFSANGRYLIASCEFGSSLIKVDVESQKVVGSVSLPGNGTPQDVKLSPNGKIFYIADLTRGGVWMLDGTDLRLVGFIPTGAGTHGLYLSRDDRYMYVTNRSAGSISVISMATNRVVTAWRIPGGSPDMGNVSANGKVLWVSGRYDAEVYAISTVTGALLARIPVGAGPHGLCVWPQPGRYSLGHTGIMR